MTAAIRQACKTRASVTFCSNLAVWSRSAIHVAHIRKTVDVIPPAATMCCMIVRNVCGQADQNLRFSANFAVDQQFGRRSSEQCAHEAVILHGLRSQGRPRQACNRGFAKVIRWCTLDDANPTQQRCTVGGRSLYRWASTDVDGCDPLVVRGRAYS